MGLPRLAEPVFAGPREEFASEFYEGVRCIASPIRDHTEKLIAAINIAGPSVRMSHEKSTQLKEPILDATTGISKKLGGP
jgi:DNA-binding IclR family transcriptional regulator